MRKASECVTTAMGFALILCLAIFGCASDEGTQGTNETMLEELTGAVGAGLEDISAADMQDLDGSSMDALAVVEDQEAGSLDLPSAVPTWWLYMYPLRHRKWHEIRRVIEAPAHLARYVIEHESEMPECVVITESGNCPVSPDIQGDSCTREIDFGDSCLIEFHVGGRDLMLELSGTLRRIVEILTAGSGPDIWDGLWRTQYTAEAFQVSDTENETPESMLYDGKLTRTSDGTEAVAPYRWHHEWKSDEADHPMTLVRGDGSALTAHGTRDAWVLPGRKVEQFLDTYPTWIPAGEEARSFHREVHRTFEMYGDTVNFSVDSRVTRLENGRRWLRRGDYILHHLSETELFVNGASRVTHPSGRACTTHFIDVLHDLHYRVPVRGRAVITFDDGLVYNVVFKGVCLLAWRDNQGHSGHINYCDWDSRGG